MLIDYKYAKAYFNEIGIDPLARYTIDDVKLYLNNDSIIVWEIIQNQYPIFFEIMDQSGNLLQYCFRHGKTIELVRKNGGCDLVLQNLINILLKQEYIPQNFFDIHYFQELIKNHYSDFSNKFIEIMYNEHNLVYNKLEQFYEPNFDSQAKLYSMLIEKSMDLVQTKASLISEGIQNGISDYQAIEEAQAQIQNLLKNENL